MPLIVLRGQTPYIRMTYYGLFARSRYMGDVASLYEGYYGLCPEYTVYRQW